MAPTWSIEDAERYLLSLELFGMRFGLDRMRRLMTALDSPERRFDSIHVVGTNGKSSTTRMIAAILERHGRRTGTYLSPHLTSFTERIRIGEADVSEAAFAAAVQRAAKAAARVDRTLAADDRVTQFEALTAAAYWLLAENDVEAGVIEAGLGGRYDATNVIPSKVQVLTSVGLEHTRWLGPTLTDIAREKLDVVQPGGTLVLGHDLAPAALAEAAAAAERAGARIVHAPPPDPADALAALGTFQRRNFALARAAAEAYLGPLDATAVHAAAAGVRVPGRLEVVELEPLTVLDGAHNVEGMTALAESLPDLREAGEETPPRPLVAVVSILDDKDAAGMLRALLPHCDHVVLTSNPNPRALSPATLASLVRQLDGPPATAEPDPRRALERARELAAERGGIALATGSIYLIADLLRAPGTRVASML